MHQGCIICPEILETGTEEIGVIEACENETKE